MSTRVQPRSRPGRTMHRMQLALPDAAYEIVSELRERTGASSYTEVIKSAIGLLRWVSDCVDDGYDVALLRDGKVLPVGSLLLSHGVVRAKPRVVDGRRAKPRSQDAAGPADEAPQALP